MPGEGEMVERNEDVGVILDPYIGESWRECVEVWNAISSTTRLRIYNKAEGRSLRGKRVLCMVLW